MLARLVAERYELRELLGEGGMGVVYRAVDTRTGGLVAIKTMRDTSDARSLEMFRKEWRVLARLSHPNIVDIRDVDEIEENGVRKPCFVMPLLSGATLAQLIKESSPRLSVAGVVGIISQVCNGLEAAHRHELVHRDLKPSNIFVMEDDTAKIIDFGLVHAADGHSVTGQKGTWQYMSPEQTEGRPPTGHSDIFSLGVVAYEALTGRKPFGRKTAEATVEAVRTCIPPTISEINPKVSQLLSKVVHKAMAKEPRHRYVSAKEFAETLKKAHRNEPIERFETSKILPRIERARNAFGGGDCAFASEILAELEAEGNVDPEITLLRAQIEEAVKQKRIRQLFEGAQTRLEQDEIPLALDKLREILTLDPGNAEALAMGKRIEEERNKQQICDWMKLARQHAVLHDFAEARHALKEVLNIRYDDSEALQLLADIDVQEKEAAKARAEKEQLYSSALKAYQGGEISYALSRLEKILEVSRRAPGATVPERDAVYQNFYNRCRSERDSIDKAYEDGRKYLNEKDFRKALEVCDEMLGRYPASAQFQALKLKVEQAERQELSAYIAEVGRSADAEPNLDRRVNILEEACKRYPNEGQFQQSLRLLREQRDLVHSILAKARQYEDQTQFADAIAQWKILRNIHPQHPGIEFEIGQLEKRREQQAAQEKKTRFVEQIDRAIESGAFARAAQLVEDALMEFPQDSELAVLEQIARQGLERVRQAERLFEDARRARSEGQFEAATELLQNALQLDDRNPGIRSALISLLVERAHARLDHDWRASEPLAEAAATIDEHHPAVKRLRTLIAEARRRAGITEYVADARQLQLSGNVQAALERVSDGLSRYPGEARLLQFQTTLQNTLDPQKQQKMEQTIDAHARAARDATRAARPGADNSDGIKDDGLTALYNRSEFIGNSAAESREAPATANSGRPANTTGESVAAITKNLAGLGRLVLVRVIDIAGAMNMAARRVKREATNQWNAAQPAQRKTIGAWISAMVLVVILALIAVRVFHHEKTPRPATILPPRTANVSVPVVLSPADARLTLDGSARPERSLVLDAKKTYDVRVSRVGYKPLSRLGVAPEKTGWRFNLEPEPLHVQVLTGERSGKILLDDQEIWDLQQGDLTTYELTPDGGHHTLSARNQTGELFKVDFEALRGASPQVAPLTTEDLLVAASLGEEGKILSGSQQSYLNLPGQQPQEITKTGTPLNFAEVDPERTVLEISNRNRHSKFAVLHGNAPTLSVSLNANPNLGSITVAAPVPNARLFLDGKETKTKKPGMWRFSGVPPGEHNLRIVAEGYVDENRAIRIDKGQDFNESIDMKPALATLMVSGATAGAEVLVDGTPVGTLNASGGLRTSVAPGQHKIDVRKEGFESVSVHKSLSRGQTLEVPSGEIALKPLGTLAFDIAPANASVQYKRADEAEWHSGLPSGALKVKSGNYEIKAAADGYESASRTVFVASGRDTKSHLELQRKGSGLGGAITTRDFFQHPDEVKKAERDWYTGQTNGYLQLKPRTGFMFSFLKPDRVPFWRREKKLKWRVSIAPDAEISYELDGQELNRRAKVNGKVTKSTTNVDSTADTIYSVKLILEAHRLVVRSRGGMTLDEFRDDQHNLSHAVVAMGGDQIFVVGAL